MVSHAPVCVFLCEVHIKELVPTDLIQPTAADSPNQINGPAQEYSRRLKVAEEQSRQLQRRHVWTGNTRVVLFGAILVLCWTIGKSGRPSVYWLIAAIVAFIVLVVLHRRILRAKSIAERASDLYKRGIARIEDRWSGVGDTGEAFATPDHVYAEDLDIFGPGSLFQLLCTARSRMGKMRLAKWLETQAGSAEILDRQSAITELRKKLDLRDDLLLAGNSDNIDANPEKLKHWSETQVDLNYWTWWPSIAVLTLTNLACLAYPVYAIARHKEALWTPFLLSLVVNGTVLSWVRHRLQSLFAGLDQACHNLKELAALLRRVEDEEFTTGRLKALREKLFASGLTASECIRRLGTLCDLEDSRHNQFVRLLELPILYSLHVACALQRWRRKYAAHVAHWIDAVGDLEALACFATYSFEHPEDPFPEISANQKGPFFEGESLGHPLLPGRDCVRNNVTLGGNRQVLLVSGSNMSGKSTLLRAVGVNAVLAMAGSAVRVRALRITPLTVGASMRISDSLQKGVSHFYAEINRVRRVVELSGQAPLLFLLDEILQGTNSHDRRVGAEGVLRTLLENAAIGLVTTHDLALTSLAEIFPHKIANVHFQERLESGKLSFDYQLRAGIVTTSNGLELMKSIGLKV